MTPGRLLICRDDRLTRARLPRGSLDRRTEDRGERAAKLGSEEPNFSWGPSARSMEPALSWSARPGPQQPISVHAR